MILKTKKKNHDRDVFGARLLGIVNCICICVLQGVWELYSLVVYETIKITLCRQN